MRISKEEKEALFELLDVMTDRCPEVALDKFETPYYNKLYWSIFKKLRLEIKGF